MSVTTSLLLIRVPAFRKLPSISEIIHADDNLLALPQSARWNISGVWSWQRGWGHCSPWWLCQELPTLLQCFAEELMPFSLSGNAIISSQGLPPRQGEWILGLAEQPSGKAGLGPVCSSGERVLLSTQQSCSKSRDWAQTSHMQPFMKHMLGKKNTLVNTEVSPTCKRPSMQFFYCRLQNQVGSLRSTTKGKKYIEEWHYMYENICFCLSVFHVFYYLPHCYR